jgi:hypothetical protein
MMEAIRPARQSVDVKQPMEDYVLVGRAVFEGGRGARKYRLQQTSISTLDEKSCIKTTTYQFSPSQVDGRRHTL